MAKKTNRQIIGLECSECKQRNYLSEKNVNNTKDKMNFNKYCRFCRKTTSHQESKLK